MEARCVRFTEFGMPQNVLKIENKKVEQPGEGEIRVRMLARPINPSDIIPIKGFYAHRISLPAVPGYEGIGIVEEVGKTVSQELLGKRVLPLRGEGTWQQFVKAPAKWAVPIPDSLEDYIGAQLYINPVTAWLACTEVLQLQQDDVLLVNACGSSLGRIFAQLSRILGFRLIAVTRNDRYTQELLQLGASNVINTSKTSLRTAVLELTGGLGADAAIDSVGGPDGADLANSLRTNGMILTIGLLSGIPVNWAEIMEKTIINVKLFHLRHWNEHVAVTAWHDIFNRLKSFIADKKLQLMKPAACYDLSSVREAVRAFQNPEFNSGKIFLTSV